MGAKLGMDELVEKWRRFFSEEVQHAHLMAVVDLYPDKQSVTVSYWDIQMEDPELAEELLLNPHRVLKAGRAALEELMPPDAREQRVSLNLRVNALAREDVIPLRDIRVAHMGRFIGVEGLVTKVTEIRPRLVTAAFECLSCGAVIRIPQDSTSFTLPSSCFKEQGGCGKPLQGTQFRLLERESDFIDMQRVELQEKPEGLRGGEQPHRLTVLFEGDLCGTVLPGNRVKINGIHGIVQRLRHNRPLNKFDIYLEGNSVEMEDVEMADIEISEEEERTIVELSRAPDIYDRMVKSLAPSIYGLTMEKEALLLLLFGGVEKHLPDGTRIRGDIHILLVGDPGTAKSQLLKYVAKIAPRGMYASGMAASKAGLTAAAVHDDVEGRFTLEAGTLVLADRGIACIDELDKMRKEDQSSMHEAMEQQTISVAKAGINATLQSRCAVLAAANPKRGRFDEFREVREQLTLEPPLISRFDAIFPIIDRPDSGYDSSIAEHMLATNILGEQLAHSGEHHVLKHGPYPEDMIDKETIRKYVAYTKRNISPVMNEEAVSIIKDFYVSLRSESVTTEDMKRVTITPRQLEALIRMSEASARVRLSPTVEAEDAQRALKIFKYFLERAASGEKGLDIDIVSTDTTASQRGRLNITLEAIKELCTNEAYRRTGPTVKDIRETLLEKGRAENLAQLEYDLKKMMRMGLIYEPTRGHYKPL